MTTANQVAETDVPLCCDLWFHQRDDEIICLSEAEVVRELSWLFYGVGQSKALNDDGSLQPNIICEISRETLTALLKKPMQIASIIRKFLLFRNRNFDSPICESLKVWLSDYIIVFWSEFQTLQLFRSSLTKLVFLLDRQMEEILVLDIIVQPIVNSEAQISEFDIMLFYYRLAVGLIRLEKVGHWTMVKKLFSLFTATVLPIVHSLDSVLHGCETELSKLLTDRLLYIKAVIPRDSWFFTSMKNQIDSVSETVKFFSKLSLGSCKRQNKNKIADEFKYSCQHYLQNFNTSDYCSLTRFNDHFQGAFSKLCCEFNVSLVTLIKHDYDLSGTLEAIRAIISLQALEGFCLTLFNIEDQWLTLSVSHNISDLMRLNHRLVSAFRASLINFFAATSQNNRFVEWSVKFLRNDDEIVFDDNFRTVGGIMNNLEFEPQIAWPLNLIISESQVNAYNKVFRFVNRLAFVKSKLVLLNIKDFRRQDVQANHNVLILRFKLLSVISSILNLVISRISENIIINALRDPRDFIQLKRNHEMIVENLLKATFLQQPADIIYRAILKFVDLANSFLEFIRNENSLPKIRLIADEVDKCHNFILYLLDKSSDENGVYLKTYIVRQ